MSQIRKKVEDKTKAKIALDAIRGDKTTAQIVSEYKVSQGQISKWKKKALDELPRIFSDQRSKENRSNELEKNEDNLHRLIGKQNVEIDWLKKKSMQLGV